MNTPISPQPLPAPTIPDAANGGLGHHDLLSSPDWPVSVDVGPWDGFQPGDIVEMLGPGMQLIGTDYASAATSDGVVRLYVYARVLAGWGDGEHEVRARIVRNGLVVASATTTVRIRLGKPGIEPDGSSTLAPPEISPTTIGPGTPGATVVIKAYANMRAGDVVNLSWGSAGDDALYTVTDLDVGKSISIPVDRSIIDAGGTGDAVDVSYHVVDDVGNTNWSPSAYVNVLDPTHLDPPAILESTSSDDVNVLDLDKLNGADATALIMPLQAGDVITLHLSGTTATGTPVVYRKDDITVTKGFLQEKLPHDKLMPLIDGSASLWYVCKRGGTEYTSHRFNFSVTGTAMPLAAPRVVEASDTPDPSGEYELDPDATLQGAAVEIPYDPRIQPGTRVEYFMYGSTADGIPIAAEGYIDIEPTTPFPLRFVVPANKIAALIGSSATFDYSVLTYAGGIPSSSVRPSASLPSAEQTYRIRSVRQPDLPAPVVPQSERNTIDPQKIEDRIGVRVNVVYPDMQINDVVTLVWHGSKQLDAYRDTLTYRGRELNFFVDEPAFLSPNLGGTVSVHYIVQREGKTWTSDTAVFNVATPAIDLAPPRLEKAPGVFVIDGKLEVAEVSEGVHIRLPEGLVLEDGDVLVAYFGEYTTNQVFGGAHADSAASARLFVPATEIRSRAGQTVSVQYTLIRKGLSYESAPLQITIVAAVSQTIHIDFEDMQAGTSLAVGNSVSLAQGAVTMTIDKSIAGFGSGTADSWWSPYSTGKNMYLADGGQATFELKTPIKHIHFSMIAHDGPRRIQVAVYGIDGATIAKRMEEPATPLRQPIGVNYGGWFHYASSVPVKRFVITDVETTRYINNWTAFDNFVLE